MKKYIYLLAAAFALSCTFASCGDDDDEKEDSPVIDNNGTTTTPTTLDKQVTKITVNEVGKSFDEYGVTYNFEYNSDGKLSKLECKDDYTMEYSYGDNSLTVKMTEEDEIQEATYVYKSGVVDVEASAKDAEGYSVSDYKYDGKELSFVESYNDKDGIEKQKITLLFNDDSSIKSFALDVMEPEKSSMKVEVEYSTTPNNLSVDLYSVLSGLDELAVTSFLGARVKYLPSKLTFTTNGIDPDDPNVTISTVSTSTFKYETDADGYITKITETMEHKYTYGEGEDDTDTEVYEYEFTY